MANPVLGKVASGLNKMNKFGGNIAGNKTALARGVIKGAGIGGAVGGAVNYAQGEDFWEGAGRGALIGGGIGGAHRGFRLGVAGDLAMQQFGGKRASTLNLMKLHGFKMPSAKDTAAKVAREAQTSSAVTKATQSSSLFESVNAATAGDHRAFGGGFSGLDPARSEGMFLKGARKQTLTPNTPRNRARHRANNTMPTGNNYLAFNSPVEDLRNRINSGLGS